MYVWARPSGSTSSDWSKWSVNFLDHFPPSSTTKPRSVQRSGGSPTRRAASSGIRRLGNAVVAAIFNIAIFGTGAAIYLFGGAGTVTGVLVTGSLYLLADLEGCAVP